MRLTLRTLLAYMDDVLDPVDHEDLGRKIEASDFATELIHRSRDASRRLGLGAAPPVADDDIHGGGSELDPNTMAEYLDNTLPPDDVGEFERACLAPGNQGDMLLAEAVSCHHILTMVLGEPAEVDADFRQRVYQLAATETKPAQSLRIEPAHAPTARQSAPLAEAAAAVAPAASAAAPSPASAAEADHVPEYLRVAAASQRRKRSQVVFFVATMIVAGGLTFLFWPQGEVKLPDEMAGVDVDAMAEGVEVGPSESESAAPVEDLDSSGPPPAFDPAVDGAPADDDAASATTDEESPEQAEMTPEETAAPEGEVGTAPAAPLETAPEAAPAEGAGEQPAIALGPLNQDQPAETAASSDKPASRPSIDEPPGAPATSEEMAAEAAEETESAMTEEKPTEDAAPIGPRPAGVYLGVMGKSDVLLAYNAESQKWARLAPRTPLTEGMRLLSLPTFRTVVTLRDSNVTLSGNTEVELVPPAAAEDALQVEYALSLPRGRLIVNSGINGNRFGLIVDDQLRVIQMDASSTLAVEVRGRYVPGRDPADGTPPRTIQWYFTTGSGTIADAAEEHKLTAPMTWTTAPGDLSAPGPIVDMPVWIDQEPVTDTQRRAQRNVVEALTPGVAVNISLLELNDPAGEGRLKEVRRLAAEAAAAAGLYEPLVKALGDVDQKAYWAAMLETIRQMLATDPGAERALYAALLNLRGERDAETLLELIIGFDRSSLGTTPEEMQAGPLGRLIRLLDSPDLDLRVLALANLNELTGTNGLGSYQPTQTAEQRARPLRIYEDRLRKGELLKRAE